MKIDELHYIGSVDIKTLRDAILDKEITEDDTLLLNPADFDNIVLSHRQSYGVSITVPYFLLGILVEEDNSGKVLRGRVGVARNDVRENRPYKSSGDERDSNYTPEMVYRCGWCGNIVDYDGARLDSAVRNDKITAYQTHGNVIEETVHGYCCKHKR